MPLNKDENGKRWVEMHFITPGTPEEVWKAMATGAGYAAWFTKAVIEEHVGGKIQFEFGGGITTSGEVTAWEPPFKFGYVERDWQEGAPPCATEIVITGRPGGKCVVRMVHSLFASTDDWDDQLESFEKGWPGFFEILGIYLAHFAGKKGACFQVMSTLKGDHLETWKRFMERLGLAGANVGEERSIPERPEKMSCVVESHHQNAKMRTFLIRLDAPAPGLALIGSYGMGENINLSASVFFYGDNCTELAAASESKWRQWMEEDFPTNATPNWGACS
jgi:uncharacterized protein YndB with AHSA1/START domain